MKIRRTNHKLSTILIISILASLALPIYIINFLEPSFSQFVAQEAEAEATLIANHMSQLFFPNPKELQEQTITAEDQNKLAQVAQAFGIIKVKIYSSQGHVIYSTDPQDRGKTNTHKYFYDIVAKGQTFSKVVQKNHTTMEGRIMPVDVVETYVPIFRKKSFAGAFEIYNDITVEENKLHQLSKKSRNISISFSFLLLLAIIFTIKQARTNLVAQKRAEDELREAHDNLELRVEKRTKDLNDLNSALTKVEQEKAELIEKLTKAVDEVKTLTRKVNGIN